LLSEIGATLKARIGHLGARCFQHFDALVEQAWTDHFQMHYLTLAILCSLAACEEGTAERGPPPGGMGNPPVSCDVTLDSCNPSECSVVKGLRLEERGCRRDTYEPAGCTSKGRIAKDVLTGGVGPDGTCWSFVNSILPFGFTFTEECDHQALSAETCAD
jgi:hypothetical protein